MVKFWEFPNQLAGPAAADFPGHERAAPDAAAGWRRAGRRAWEARARGQAELTRPGSGRRGVGVRSGCASRACSGALGGRGPGESLFAQYPRRAEGRRGKQQVTEQRNGWPSQSWSCCCSTCSPNKCSYILVGGQRGGGYWSTPLPCRGPHGCSPAGRAARLP
ncbi:uncharacterized protein LOC107970009 isoform X2 [Pan troglodytes]|uniref:uncharacterized protein LOC107970009 isoform X2 n=1 Tax=Pan troglodytes TaxID=9598 RepID=UPI0030137769